MFVVMILRRCKNAIDVDILTSNKIAGAMTIEVRRNKAGILLTVRERETGLTRGHLGGLDIPSRNLRHKC